MNNPGLEGPLVWSVFKELNILCLQEKNLEWFPRMRAMSLAAEDGDGEQNELRTLHVQLNSTNELVQLLSQQLYELKEQVMCCLEVSVVTLSFMNIHVTLHPL